MGEDEHRALVFRRDADKADGDCIFAAAQRDVEVEGRAGVNPKPAFAEDGLDVCPRTPGAHRLLADGLVEKHFIDDERPLSRQRSS